MHTHAYHLSVGRQRQIKPWSLLVNQLYWMNWSVSSSVRDPVSKSKVGIDWRRHLTLNAHTAQFAVGCEEPWWGCYSTCCVSHPQSHSWVMTVYTEKAKTAYKQMFLELLWEFWKIIQLLSCGLGTERKYSLKDAICNTKKEMIKHHTVNLRKDVLKLYKMIHKSSRWPKWRERYLNMVRKI